MPPLFFCIACCTLLVFPRQPLHLESILPNNRNGDGTKVRNNSTPNAKLENNSNTEQQSSGKSLFRLKVGTFI